MNVVDYLFSTQHNLQHLLKNTLHFPKLPFIHNSRFRGWVDYPFKAEQKRKLFSPKKELQLEASEYVKFIAVS